MNLDRRKFLYGVAACAVTPVVVGDGVSLMNIAHPMGVGGFVDLDIDPESLLVECHERYSFGYVDLRAFGDDLLPGVRETVDTLETAKREIDKQWAELFYGYEKR